MYAVIAQIARLLPGVLPTEPGIPRQLMEGAEASAGQDPRHAHELREAAYAYLRVVR